MIQDRETPNTQRRYQKIKSRCRNRRESVNISSMLIESVPVSLAFIV